MITKEAMQMYNKMTKKQLIQEIERFNDFIDFIIDRQTAKYVLYPPYYTKDEWPYNYPNPLPKWPVTCFTKSQEGDTRED